MTVPRLLPVVLVATTLIGASAQSTAQHTGAGAPPGEGRFVWQDLVTTDASAARQFYKGLLGWEFADSHRGGRSYLIAHTAAGVVGGIVDVHDVKDAASQWVSYVAVADVDRAVQQVVAAGGKVLVAPSNSSAGRAGVVADPQGAALGLLAPSKAVPPDPPKPLTDHFFWHEYLAGDGPKALDFYKTLLGYEASNTDSKLGLEYFVLRRDGARAGLLEIPKTVSQVKPNWLPYVLVDDPAALAKKAVTLGGRILLEPSAERRNGTLAIVADPTGGVVALQKYPIS